MFLPFGSDFHPMQVLSQGFSRDRVVMIRDSINGDEYVMGEMIFQRHRGSGRYPALSECLQ